MKNLEDLEKFINSELPRKLNQLVIKRDKKLIHFSTDCVFGGYTGGYDENSIKDAIDDYGKTKSLGEFNSEFNLCIRTSIIGPEIKQNGEGLLHWIFQQKGKVYGYKNVFWSGVTTLELSKAIDFSIENNVNGLWNFTNSEPIPEHFIKLGRKKIETLIKKIGIFRIKAKSIYNLSRILVRDYKGKVPKTFEELEKLPGVGHLSASVVMSHGFGHPAFPVDTHIHRLAQRWGLTNGKSVVQTAVSYTHLRAHET